MIGNHEIEKDISYLVSEGIYDPKEICSFIPDITDIEAAFYMDLAALHFSSDWTEKKWVPGEVYQAETFPHLVDSIPGLLIKTREQLKTTFHQLCGLALFQQIIDGAIDQQEDRIFRFPALEKGNREKHYLLIHSDRSGRIEVCLSNSVEEKKGYQIFYVGDGYFVQTPLKFINQKTFWITEIPIFRQQLIKAISPSLPEETRILRNLLRSLEEATRTDKSPVDCVYQECFFIRYLANVVGERKDLTSLEADLFISYLKKRGIFLLTSARFALYQKLEKAKRGVASTVFFPYGTTHDETRLANTVFVLKKVVRDSPHRMAEEIPVADFSRKLSVGFSPQKGKFTIVPYLLKYVPDYGVLMPAKARLMLANKEVRERVMEIFFPTTHSRHRHNLSEEELRILTARSKENIRIFVKTYAELKRVNFEELSSIDLESRILLMELAKRFHAGQSTDVFLYRAFPDEYCVLTQERAQPLLTLKNKRKKKLLCTKYFGAVSKQTMPYYTDEEIRHIQQRLYSNAKVAIEAYLALNPKKTLESLRSSDLLKISAAMVHNIAGGFAPRYFLFKLFPDSYGVLTQEKAEQFLTLSGREKNEMSRVYFRVIKERDPEYRFYTPDEREKANKNALENARMLIRCYASTRAKILEELSYIQDKSLFMQEALYSLMYNLSAEQRETEVMKRQRSIPVLLAFLFPHEYGILTREKYQRWRKKTQSFQKKGYRGEQILTMAFFGVFDELAKTPKGRALFIRRAEANARNALNWYLEDRGKGILEDVTGRDLRKLFMPKCYRLFGIPGKFPHILVWKLFPDEFAVMTYSKLTEFLLNSPDKKRISLGRVYFGSRQLFENLPAAYTEAWIEKRQQNALVLFLGWLKTTHLTPHTLVTQSSEVVTKKIPDAICRVLGVRRTIEDLGRAAQQFFYPDDDPERFFWKNVITIVDPAIFLELSSPANITSIQGMNAECLGVVSEKVLASRYPYSLAENNVGVRESKIRLLNYLLARIREGVDIPRFKVALSTALNDRYQEVRMKAYTTLHTLYGSRPELVISVLRLSLFAGDFSYREFMSSAKQVSSNQISEWALSPIGEEINRVLKGLPVIGTAVDTDYDESWKEEYPLIVKGLKDRLVVAATETIPLVHALSLTEKVITYGMTFLTEATTKLLVGSLKKSRDSGAEVIPILPLLLTHKDNQVQNAAKDILEELRRRIPLLREEECNTLETVLQKEVTLEKGGIL